MAPEWTNEEVLCYCGDDGFDLGIKGVSSKPSILHTDLRVPLTKIFRINVMNSRRHDLPLRGSSSLSLTCSNSPPKMPSRKMTIRSSNGFFCEKAISSGGEAEGRTECHLPCTSA